MPRTFDWVSSHDERSRSFPIRGRVEWPPRSYTWACRTNLDQGVEGACVGFAWAHELAARPKVVEVSATTAYRLYGRARQLDVWPGETYEGTSVLAGAKAVRELGHIVEFRWSFNVTDLAFGVGHAGPAVLGLDWYESMMYPDAAGRVEVAGDVVGGHAILCRAVSVKRREFLLHNSWGSDWGVNGGCWVSFDAMERLLADHGEACFPVRFARRLAQPAPNV